MIIQHWLAYLLMTSFKLLMLKDFEINLKKKKKQKSIIEREDE